MDFELDARFLAIRERAQRVAREVVAPRAAEIDRSGIYPQDVFDAFKQEDLLGLSIPESVGGGGAGTLGLALAVEEIAKYCSSSGLLLLMTKLTTAGILFAGTEAQVQHYVRGVATGTLRGAFALTEPHAGSDSAAITTTARREGETYVLNGAKRWAGQATVADFCLVVAKTDPEAGARGVSMFIVDLPNPGFRITRELPKMGVLGVPVVDIELQDCRIPVANLVGRENHGFALTMQHLNSVRPIVAARGLGLAQGTLQYAVDYAQQRQTFGKPIIEHEAIAFKMAERAMEIEAARWLTYRAAWLVDKHGGDKTIAPYLSMAKAYASEMAVRTAEDALQILGGNGYLKDHETERHYRDAKQLTIVEGTSEIHRLIISRAIAANELRWRDGL